MSDCTVPGHDGGWPDCVDCEVDRVATTTGARRLVAVEVAQQPPKPISKTNGNGKAHPIDAMPMLRPHCDKCGHDDHDTSVCGNRFVMPPPEVADPQGVAEGRYGPPAAGTSVVVADSQGDKPQGSGPHLPNLPDKFWEARPLLGRIRHAAHRVGRSADAVLGCVLARVAAMTSHELRFDFCLGPGTLNLYCALIGWPAAGKSKASDRATDLLVVPRPLIDPELFKDGIGLGSGEGLAEVFMGTVERDTGRQHQRNTKDANKGDPITEKVRAQVRHNVYIYVDEGEKLTKQLERQGATAGATLRTGWSGGTLGEANATEERNRSIPRWTYSLGMVIGYQPTTVRPLLADIGPGTPQRFLWFSAHDPGIPTEPPADDQDIDPIELAIVDGDGSLLHGTMTADPEIRRRVWDWNNGPARGAYRLPDLDGHVLVMHCKLSALFAILDGRTRVTEDDWGLAAMLWDTSCGVRDSLVEWTASDHQQEAERRADAYVEREERAQLARTQVDAKVVRVASWIARHVRNDGATARYLLRKKAASRDLPFWAAAEDHAVTHAWITVDEDRIMRPGTSRPA